MAKKTPTKPWAWGGITPGQQSAIASGFTNRSQVLTGKVGFQPFKPYVPPPVPTGSYDPAIDAQVGQANRGLGDLVADTETARTRGTVDYGLGVNAINLGADRQVGDLNTNQARSNEDWQTQSNLLQRQYQILAGQQAEGARHSGVQSTGIAAMSAAKRAANQQIQQSSLDTTHDRSLADIATALSRTGQDRDLALGNLALNYAPPSADNPLGGRSFQDLTTALTRGQRENTQFGLDATAEKLFQAGQQGYVPPGRGDPGGIPTNEHITATGEHTRTVTIGGVEYTYDEKGRIIRRKTVKPPPSGRVGTAGSGKPSAGRAPGFTAPFRNTGPTGRRTL